ncbi:ATP-binding protein [Bradyrhizobium sp.]|uniref:sensor histidine kinase n=1 Tax=Bradyrhizobium sp. TaxID=376 RepID=UPI003C4415FF
MMSQLSVRSRLIILSGMLLCTLIFTNLFLTAKLENNSRAVATETELSEVIESATGARIAFGEMRYWLADLAVSLLTASERNAAAARTRMDGYLEQLAKQKPALVAKVRVERAAFEQSANDAVDKYTNDQRVLGNSLLAQARNHSVKVDEYLTGLVDELRGELTAERQRITGEVRAATKSTMIADLAILALGVLLTFAILRSIAIPLRELVATIDRLSAGDLSVSIPAASPNEIGAMAGALGLFRDSLRARDRFAAEAETQRKTIAAAIATISEGFVLYDSDDRIVLFNDQFRAIYPGLSDVIRRGMGFDELLESVISRKLVDLGSKSPEQWIAERKAQHQGSDDFVEYQYRERYVRISERSIQGGGSVAIYTDITELRRRNIELEQARDSAEIALRELQTAQDRLIQSEKLASLGQLTAGIAHEIKNPLNFVNNFSSLSTELIDELNDLLGSVAMDTAAIDTKVRAEMDELTQMLKRNLEKVVKHGKRADSIVKNMLLHSREGVGERRPADINAIVEESLNLAYHGARAEKSGFNITLERDLDPSAGIIDLYPQEITRALLNLISNGFYAANKRKEADNGGFKPSLTAITKNLGHMVEIRIRDNGTGIPADVREKMFNPFFTTKPAGEGTGLGLSLSHDIVVKQHGGKIEVDTESGKFTEFIITLPRAAAAKTQAGGLN